MVCARCKLDKEPCLFPPCSITTEKRSYQLCRKCWSESRGHEFGKQATKRPGKPKFYAAGKYADQRQNVRSAIRQQEQQALLEARRKRLRGGSVA